MTKAGVAGLAALVGLTVWTVVDDQKASTKADQEDCHPAYQGACLPKNASGVDCGSGDGNGPAYVYEQDFRVVGSDVYGLDRDDDGIACE